MHILIVEDDHGVLRFIKKGLTESGYTVDTASTGDEGLYFATTQSYELIILDIMLPGVSGYGIIKRVRKMEINTPVIFLTAKDAQEDILHGFNLGADDYLVKPFSFAELLARIKAVLRRGPEKQIDKLCTRDLVLDLIKHEVSRNNEKIDLSAKEFLLLEYLLRNKGQVLTRTMILEQVWGYSFETSSNIIDVHINRLRSKVDKNFDTRLIHTVKGVGYVLKKDD